MKNIVKYLRGKWHRLTLLLDALGITSSDPEEKAWYEKHFDEIVETDWKLFKLSRAFNFLYSEKKRKDRDIDRTFFRTNHPLSSTRQLADWRRLGPENTPPAVKRQIARLAEVSRKARQKTT